MDLLLVATELFPYVQTSPIAQRVSALMKNYRLLGHQVSVVLPRSPEFEAQGVLAARRLTPLTLRDGKEALLFQAELSSGAKLLLVETPESTREAFFEAVVALALESVELGTSFSTVHSFGEDASGLHERLRETLGSDQITVHTPFGEDVPAKSASGIIYFSESQAEAHPATQASLAVGGALDVAIDNPATDSSLRYRFDPEAVANKGRNKAAFLEENKLDLDPGRPLVVVPESKNTGVALEAAIELVRQGVTVAYLTNAELGAIDKSSFETLAGSLAVVKHDAAAERRALGAADFALILEESKSDTTVLLRAQRYGAVPIALARGATKDRLVDVDAELATGTGLLFDVLSPRSVVLAVGRAIAAYRSPNFPALLRRILRQEFGWERAARRHLQFYRQLEEASARR